MMCVSVDGSSSVNNEEGRQREAEGGRRKKIRKTTGASCVSVKLSRE